MSETQNSNEYDYEQFLEELDNNLCCWDEKNDAPWSMTKKFYPYKALFTPIKINGVEIKNRIVMGPMSNVNMCDPTGRPDDKMIAYYEARARGGVGLITTGMVPTSFGIDPTLAGKDNLSGYPRIDNSETNLVGWRNLAYAVHNYGSKIFIQLSPGLGRVGNPKGLMGGFKWPVSASLNPNFYLKGVPCMRLSDSDIKKIIKKTVQASVLAKQSGIDGVYLHGHEGYLLEQFANTAFNHRRVGKFSNYEKLGLDLVSKIRQKCGNDYPIMYRIDLSLMLNAVYGQDIKKFRNLRKFKNERLISETLKYMEDLIKAGVDAFDVDVGCYENFWLPHPTLSMPSGCYLDVANMVKQHFDEKHILSNAGLVVPIVAVGKLGYPDLAEEAIIENKCDMIMLARPLLADPDWAVKVFCGKVENIRPCIGCNRCITEFMSCGHIQCAVCPTTAFENNVLNTKINKESNQLSVGIVGNGLGEMIAGVLLARKGHCVTTYKTSDTMENLFDLATPKIKYELKNYFDYIKQLVEKTQNTHKLDVKTISKLDFECLKQQNHDVVITASGYKQNNVSISGAVQKHVLFWNEALQNLERLKIAKNIVVIGGGSLGCEMAYFIKSELKKEVVVLEESPYLMSDSCMANRGHILHYFKKFNVKCFNMAKVVSINEDNVEFWVNISRTKPYVYNAWAPIPLGAGSNSLKNKIKVVNKAFCVEADLVIIATGMCSDNDVYKKCVEHRVASEIYNINGDCGDIFTIVHSAFNLCKDL